MSIVGQSRSLTTFICMPKTREPNHGDKTHILFSHCNKKGIKTDDPMLSDVS